MPTLQSLPTARRSLPVSLVDQFAGGPPLRDDISIEDYHADRSCVSTTVLKAALRSPQYCRHLLLNGVAQTDAMRMGTAYHMRVLEPAAYKWAYAVAPDIDRRTKPYKEFVIANAGREILTHDEAVAIEGMAAATHAHPTAHELLEQGLKEVTLIWQDEETGLWIKIRPDCLNAGLDTGVCLDLKKTANASKRAFSRDCRKFDYDVQAAVYAHVLRKVFGRDFDFAFFACEDTAPYGAALYGAPDSMLAEGQRRMRLALNTIARCQQNGIWPGYQPEGGYEVLSWQDSARFGH
jgi:hypothetical protein